METGNITIGGFEDPIAVNANASRVYVADGSSLLDINTSSHSVIAKVKLPASSTGGIALDQGTNTVYVSVEGGIVIVNGLTDVILGEFPIHVDYLAYNPNTHVLYGSQTHMPYLNLTETGNLIATDVRTGSVIANISMGSGVTGLTLNPRTNMVFVVGCANSFVCGEEVQVINGTTSVVVNTVKLYSGAYGRIAMNLITNTVYVSGSQLIALSGFDGTIIFRSYPQTCSPFINMTVDSTENQVLAALQNYNYLAVYDGTETLVNMYSLPDSPLSVAFNPSTHEVYVTFARYLLTFHVVLVTGNVNPAAIGAGERCGLP